MAFVKIHCAYNRGNILPSLCCPSTLHCFCFVWYSYFLNKLTLVEKKGGCILSVAPHDLFIFDILSNVKLKQLSCSDPKLIIPCPSWVLNAGWSPSWSTGGLVGFTLLILLGRITQICLWSDRQRLGKRYILYLSHEFSMFKGSLFITALCFHFLVFLEHFIDCSWSLDLLDSSQLFKAMTQQFDLCNYTICTKYSFSGLKV